jgi:hypothetical protein
MIASIQIVCFNIGSTFSLEYKMNHWRALKALGIPDAKNVSEFFTEAELNAIFEQMLCGMDMLHAQVWRMSYGINCAYVHTDNIGILLLGRKCECAVQKLRKEAKNMLRAERRSLILEQHLRSVLHM